MSGAVVDFATRRVAVTASDPDALLKHCVARFTPAALLRGNFTLDEWDKLSHVEAMVWMLIGQADDIAARFG